jgi:hypothetical protein
MPRSTFQYPTLRVSESTYSLSEKGEETDPFGDSAQTSRPESYVEPYRTNSRPPLNLGRGNGQRTLSDLYDESPPITPMEGKLRPGRPWMSGSRPESEATLISSYPPTPSPLVRIIMTRLSSLQSNHMHSEVQMLSTRHISQAQGRSMTTMNGTQTHSGYERSTKEMIMHTCQIGNDIFTTPHLFLLFSPWPLTGSTSRCE